MNPGIDLGVITLSQNAPALDRQSLARCDVVVLCGYRGSLREFPVMLNDYVVRGGNIVFIPTMQSDYAAINSELGSKGIGLLPLDFEKSVLADSPESLRFDHWAMRVFTQCESLSDTLKFKRICPVKNGSTGDKRQYSVVAQQGGRPLMIIASRGAGHVSQWFVSPLPQWSNMSAHLSYPVVWRDLIAWLCCPVETEKVVDEPLVFSLARLDYGAVCGVDYFREETKEPLGNIEFASRDGRFVANLNNIIKSGFYALSSAENSTKNTAKNNSSDESESCLRDESGYCFAVNVDRRESALDAASNECLRELQRLGVKCRVNGADGTYSAAASQSVADTFLILLILVLILWELGLSNLFYRSSLFDRSNLFDRSSRRRNA